MKRNEIKGFIREAAEFASIDEKTIYKLLAKASRTAISAKEQHTDISKQAKEKMAEAFNDISLNVSVLIGNRIIVWFFDENGEFHSTDGADSMKAAIYFKVGGVDIKDLKRARQIDKQSA